MISNLNHFRGSRFRGVVPLPSGHWGSSIQIHAGQKPVWLGTFKSEDDAAWAFDSAATKLRTYDPYRNFVSSDLNNVELKQKHGSNQIGSDLPHHASHHKLLFNKILTLTDAGKWLLIPKEHAINYFSNVAQTTCCKSIYHHGNMNEIYIEFYDSDMTPWRFRYCCWESTHSFVFTKGWRQFVEAKRLKPKDIVSFYECRSQGRRFLLIDVTHSQTEPVPSAQPGRPVKEEPQEFEQKNINKFKTIRLFGQSIDAPQ